MKLNIFSRHVSRLLSAYVNGEASQSNARRIAKHLEICPRCRAEYENIAFGARLANRLPRAAHPPDAVWNAIQLHLQASEREGFTAPSGGRRRPLWRTVGATAAVALVVAAALWHWGRFHTPQIRLHASSSAILNPLERTARDLYLASASGDVSFDLTDDSPQVVSDWARRRHGLRVDLADARPTPDAGRYQLIGAKTISIGAQQGVLVTYRIDSSSVALLTTHSDAIADAPREAWFAKAITYRNDLDAGVKILTWTRKGQSYALASTLPNVGEESCFICHVAPARRNLIRSMALEVRQ
jgi:hypothetical protein